MHSRRVLRARARMLALCVTACVLCAGAAPRGRATEERRYPISADLVLRARVPVGWTETFTPPGDDGFGNITYETGQPLGRVQIRIVALWVLRRDGHSLTHDDRVEWMVAQYVQHFGRGYVLRPDLSAKATEPGVDIVDISMRGANSPQGPGYWTYLSSLVEHHDRELFWDCYLETDDPKAALASPVGRLGSSMRLASSANTTSASDLSVESSELVESLVSRVNGYYTALRAKRLRALKQYRRGGGSSEPISAERRAEQKAILDNVRILSWEITEIGLLENQARVVIDREVEARARPGTGWTRYDSQETLFWDRVDGTWYVLDPQSVADWDPSKATYPPIPAGGRSE